jgi:hypothetical protein
MKTSKQLHHPIKILAIRLSNPPMKKLGLLNCINCNPFWHGTLLAVVLTWFALSPTAPAVSPPPDGGYPNANTAEGINALFSLTSGFGNTANGFEALLSNTTGNANTANGSAALLKNTTGIQNTATGGSALSFNTTGNVNTANGFQALGSNTTGVANTATGAGALFKNTTGNFNTANGFLALNSNTTGVGNTATGIDALSKNTTGVGNTATGDGALQSNTTGTANTATSNGALVSNTTGKLNTAVGDFAGQNLTTGNNNIDVGNPGALAAESNIIRIGTVVAFTDKANFMHPAHSKTFIAGIHGVAVTGSAVTVNSNGQLGVAPSSERFKEAIKPMDKTSEAILSLQPVTFRYKKDLDPNGIPQFGLVAEEVEKVNPDLVARDEEGKPYTVRYEAVNAMLLNEFLKEHRQVRELKSIVARQEATIAQQQKDFKLTAAQQQMEIKALTAGLKEQASQIRKVSAQLEISKVASQVAANN